MRLNLKLILLLLITNSYSAISQTNTTVELFESNALESVADSLPQSQFFIRITNLSPASVETIECVVIDKIQEVVLFRSGYSVSQLEAESASLEGEIILPTGLSSEIHNCELRVARWESDGNSLPLLVYELNN